MIIICFALQQCLNDCARDFPVLLFLCIERMCSTKTFFILANNKGITRSSDWKLKNCVIFSLEMKMEFLAVRLIKL